MNARLARYVWEVYRRDILGESRTLVEMPELTQEIVKDAKTEMARIDALHLGAHLISRDFASYQVRRALAALLAETEK